MPAFVMYIAAAIAVLSVTSLAMAQSAKPAPQNRAAFIDACMKEARGNLKAGQKLTPMQRMTAEEQCRAMAESQEQQQAAPKR